PRHAFCDAVMVTRDEVDVPRQTTAEIDRFTLCDFQGEIAEVVYQVPRLDQRIVAVDDRLVHFVDVSKRAAPPQREDIVVPEVVVGGEPEIRSVNQYFHNFFSWPLALGIQ